LRWLPEGCNSCLGNGVSQNRREANDSYCGRSRWEFDPALALPGVVLWIGLSRSIKCCSDRSGSTPAATGAYLDATRFRNLDRDPFNYQLAAPAGKAGVGVLGPD
jgi:hypothetical protein